MSVPHAIRGVVLSIVVAVLAAGCHRGSDRRLSAAKSSVTVAPGAVVADGVTSATITAVVRNQDGGRVQGQTVDFAASGVSFTITQPAGPTDGTGTVTATIVSTLAELKTITATVVSTPTPLVLDGNPTVEFLPDAGNIGAAQSSVSVSPALDVIANDVELATVTVTVRDVNGNPVPGQTFAIASDGTNDTLTQPAGTTDANGQATATLSTLTAETKTITVTVNPGPGQVVLNDTPTVRFIGDPATIDAAGSTATASPGSDVVANGVDTSTLTVTVRDIHGNAVAGQTVQFAATGTNNTLVQPAGPTDANGQATATLASTTAETKDVSITINPGPGQTVLVAAMPAVDFIGDAATIGAGLSSVSVGRATGVLADGADASPITVVVRDVNSNPVGGQMVQIDTTGTNYLILPSLFATDVDGQVLSDFTSTSAEVMTLTVSVNPGPGVIVLTDMPSVEFVGDPSTIDALTSSAAASPAMGVIADGTDASTITVVVRDVNGNPVEGQLVQLDSSGTNNTITPVASLTDAAGQVLATMATTTSETKTITVILNPGSGQVVLADMPTIAFGADATMISAALSSAIASPATGVVADGVEVSTVTVTVRDVNGNPLPSQMVQIASSGTNNTLTQPGGPTDAAGQATASLASTTAELKTITVTVNPGPGQLVLSDMPTIDLVADTSTIDAALSSASASPASGVIADDVETSTLTVTVRDANGNPVPGQTVQVAASGTNNTLTQPAGPTDANGQATATLSTVTAETKTLTVTLNPGPGQVVLTDTPSVDFVGDPTTINGVQSSAVASPVTGVLADDVETSVLTVTVRDVNGNPVAGQTVQVTASGTNNTLTQPAGPTDANGVATATLATTTAETKTLMVMVNPGPTEVLLSDMPTVEFVADPATIDAALSSASASPASGVIADDVDTSTVTITVRDVNGNPVSGQTVQIASDGTNNTLTQPAGPTDAAGQATATLSTTTAETKTLTITVNPGPGQVVLADMPAVDFVADTSTIDAALSSASASPASGVIADDVETSTVTVTVRDANGNPVSGQTVQIASDGTNNTLTQPAGPTDAAGQATATLSTTTAETKTLTVTVNPGPGQVVLADMPAVDFVADTSTIDAALSSASASPASGVIADDVETSTVTVTVRDANGNPVAGQTVQIASDGTSNTLTQPAGPTGASGVATATISTTTAETKTLTVTVNPGPGQVVLADTPTVEFVADTSTIDAVLSSVTASPATGVVADDVDTSTITITVLDANGNPVAGQTVQVASSGTNNTLIQTAGPTDANGQATATIATTTAETKTLTVTVNPGPGQVVLADMPTVAFVGDPSTINGTSSSAVAGPATGVVADGVTTSTITVTVRDINGNPVAGQTVQISSTGTNNTLTQPAGATDAAGQATATISTLSAETKTLSVMVNPGPAEVLLSDMPTIAFAGDPATIDAGNSSATAFPQAGVIADGVETATLTITVHDINNNPVSGQTVQIASTGTNNTLTQPAGPTDAAGRATAAITSTTAETKTITVTVNPGPGQVVLSDMPTVDFEGDPSTIDAAASSAVASPATGVIADDADATTVTITVRDVNNNPVAGQLVQIAASGTNNTLTQPASLTDASGQTTAGIATITAETKTITVTVNPGPSQVVLSDMPTVAFVGDPSTIDALTSNAAASPASGLIADDVDTATITVTVRDANGNPVSGQTVELASSGSNNTLTQPAGPTDASGQATATLSSTTAETKTITVTVNPIPPPFAVVLIDMPTIEFVGDPSTVDAANSSATASPATGVVADDVETSTVTITVRDANNNPVSGQTVQIASSGSDNTLTQPAGTTDTNGVATATISTITAETKTITVTVNPGPSQIVLTDTPTVDFVGDPSTLNGTQSSAVASPATGVVADGVATSTVTVTVRDINGNPVAGQTVQISSTGTNNTLIQPAGPTDASGIATATITSTTAETKVVSVMVNPGPSELLLSDMPAVEFVADPSTIDAALSSASASPATGVVADDVDTSTVTVTVLDVNGNPVSGQTVQIASDGTNNTLTQPAGPTDASGQATATISTTTAETKTITVTVNPGPGQVVLSDLPTVDFEGDPTTMDAALSSATASPASGVVADGVTTSTLTVTVRDVNGNPVAGRSVQVAATGTNNTLTQPATLTDASGQTTATLSTITAETKTITVTVDPGPNQVVLSDMPTVDFEGDPATIDAALSSASASPTSGVVANDIETSTITVTVLDANSNPVSGQTVQIASDGTNNTLTQPAGPTDASGQATATIATTTAETKTITVTINPGPGQVVLSDMPTVDFEGDPATIDAALSSASASPTSGVVADDVETSTITVTVLDANSNPVSGQTVQIASDGTNNTLTQPAGPTDASGQATATIATTTAETKTITITVNPGPSQVVLSDMPTVDFEGDPATIDAALSSASASPTSGVVADDVETSTITVTVLDANSNPVPGQTVQIASDGTNNTLTQPAGPTDASGQATATLSTTTAETKTITVTVNPGPGQVVLSNMPTVDFVADPSTIDAALSSASASPTSGVVADDVETSTITVTVLDANSNPVSGQTVQIASSGTNNTLTQPAGPTDASGQATATIATTTAETKTITITVNPGPSQVVLADMPTVAFVGDPSTISATGSSATSSPASGLLADGSDSTTVTVTVRDANGNPVAGQTVQLVATGSENTLTQPGATTDASGQASGTLATAAAELKTVTVTVNPGPSQVVLSDTPQTDFVWPQASTYYVRVSGSDAGSGTSPADAWLTIGMAASSVAAGDTVYVGAGTYNESVLITTDGTAGNPITFVADACGYTGDPGSVIVDAGGATSGFQIDGADYVVIDGFTITGAVAGVGAGGGIYVGTTTATGVTLRDNTLYGNDRGIDIRNAASVTVESNRISNNIGAAADGIQLRASNDVTILNNLVYNNGRYGLATGDGSLNLLVEGNTFHANGSDQVRANGGLNTVTLRNNVVTSGAQDGLDFTDGSTGTSTYNLVWANSGVDWNGLAMGAGDQSADPAFVDPDGADNLLGGAQGVDDQFQLDSGLPSPALDAGSTTAGAISLSDGTTLADRTSRTDEVLDGTSPDAATVNLGHHYGVSLASLAALDTDDARLVFGLTDGGQVSTRTWDDSAGSWSARGNGPPVGADLRWTVNRISPLTNDEELALVLSDTGSAGVLDMLQWNGVCWTEEWSSSAIDVTHADKRGFDLELEGISSDALAVYSNNTATPVYRTRTDGVWGAETPLPLNDGAGPNPDPNSGIVLWIELARRPGTDELALAYVDANADLVTMIWDGTQWLTASATLLESNVKTNPVSLVVHNRAFDAAYENGGDLMVAWSRNGAFGFFYSTKAAGSTTFSAATAVSSAPSSGVPHHVDLAAEPGGDRIAGGFFDMGDATERLGLSVWNGTAWVDSGEYDSQILDVNDAATGDFQGAVGWVGTSGVAVCIYADNQNGTLDWARWAGAGWSLQTDAAIAGKGSTQSVFIESFTGQDSLMAILSDSNADLFTATYDGTTWTVLSSGSALETTLSAIDSAPFGLAIE